MPLNQFEQVVTLPVTAKTVYDAWLSSEKHSAMTGSPAVINNIVGNKFTAWDGYIQGVLLSVNPSHCSIEQLWHANEPGWPTSSPSTVTIHIKTNGKNSCKLYLKHKDVPSEHMDAIYQGWKDYYWNPMKDYFTKK